ncbi:putative ADP-ribosylation factor GTPase-activating protein AGD14 isoform X1 [Prunus yedoensis var. nudiflora]|uniref:Putative ADP-ribosylation factor GTPase-activating protein AGD14 isoform X1 n=1 Tax=Prunus yedoensis var. nudiflora TaxID=2094558 RepID=A0A315A180_PRUYE|nr:putative ADP-ribosylation factor GTPase-activating protein AGD14 isoform X1 [Prunus yedoensis var. nudiflora]
MTTRKEEERNEKIIRGLMKLPPNRRCINCNSLGPQYVCTNFWTFVCITCSGIHREFTHRVKSVSMSKFTSQEVEALQNGGNQRAREIYLMDWDLQRQRLPDNSKVDKIREFIRSVYVDRKYAGGRTSEKPPRDMQNHRIREDETRRASSYHSYSQSPPYDYQYEDRRYGKQAAVLTRKPGSDRGRYEGNMSSFVYSAGRLSEQMYEDRFANEGSGSRVSDFSVSSGGDASRSGVQSPNFQKEIGSSSPPFPPSSDNLTEVSCQAKNVFLESNFKRDAAGITCPQRTASSGSFGSVGSYSMPALEPEQAPGIFQDESISLTGSSLFGSNDSLDLFKALVKPKISSAAPSIDLFHLPAPSSSLSTDLFQPPVSCSDSSVNVGERPKPFSPTSLELFADFPQQQSTATLAKQVPDSFHESEGWATFDTPQPSASVPGTESITPENIASNGGGSIGNFDPFSPSKTSMQWPSFQYSSIHGPSSDISSPWSDSLHNVTAPNTTSTQSWSAFEDSIVHLPLEGTKKGSEPGATDKLSSAGDHYLGFRISEDSSEDGIQRAVSQGEPHDPALPSHVVLGQSYTPQGLPQMGEIKSDATDHKSNNPFDLPYDTDLDQNNVFLDMSSLQASLPNAQLQSSFLGGVSQAWFPQNTVSGMSYPAAAEGGLTYMPGQAHSSQIPNVPTQGPVASIGGNPFA